MFKAIKEFLFGKPAEQTATPVAPYKVETPVTVSTVVVDASLDNKPQVVAAEAPRTKKPAAKKSAGPRQRAAKKPAAKKPTPTPN
jgi:hypothetical protein